MPSPRARKGGASTRSSSPTAATSSRCRAPATTRIRCRSPTGPGETPHVALIPGRRPRLDPHAYIIYKNSDTQVGASLLYMAVFGAVISYFMQCLSFILLRRRPAAGSSGPIAVPSASRGAAVAGVIALCSLGSDFLQRGLPARGLWSGTRSMWSRSPTLGAAGRHRLVFSPEEEFAMTLGAHGHPEVSHTAHC